MIMLKDISDYLVDSSNFNREYDIGSFKKEKLSIVYIITEKNTHKQYVGKQPNVRELIPRNIIDFLREIHILTSNYPSILKLKGWSFDEYPLIITYKMENGALNDCIKKSSKDQPFFTSTQKQIILYGVAKGIQYLHSKNIINRDIKSANILLDDHFYPKICDFNLSKFTNDIYSVNQSVKCYTEGHEAPEIHTQNYNCSVDAYSFGIVVYELLADQIIEEDSSIDLNKINESNDFIELINKCNNTYAEERPDFDTITDFLSSNYLENVDIDEFDKYKEMIEKEEKKAQMIELKENEEMSSDFYSLALSKSNPGDIQKRKVLMKISAYLGYDIGQYKYAEMMIEENNENDAIKYLLMAESQKYIPAFYLHGFILEKNSKFIEAEECFANGGELNEISKTELFKSVDKLIKSFVDKKDIKEAIKLIKFGIKQENMKYVSILKEIADNSNDDNAQYEYAKIISESDPSESIQYYKKAANQRHIDACLEMSNLLSKKQLFEKFKIEESDRERNEDIEKYLTIAADQNSTEALLKLGIFYANKKNIKMAKKCFQKAMNIDNKYLNVILNYAIILGKERKNEENEMKRNQLFEEQFKYLKELANKFMPAKYHYAKMIMEIRNNLNYWKTKNENNFFQMIDISDESYLKNLKKAYKNGQMEAIYDYSDFIEKEANKKDPKMIYKYGKLLLNKNYPIFDEEKGMKYMKEAKNQYYQKAILYLKRYKEGYDNAKKLPPTNI